MDYVNRFIKSLAGKDLEAREAAVAQEVVNILAMQKLIKFIRKLIK